jgi:4,5-dihydroxyphthalate decarboxylase
MHGTVVVKEGLFAQHPWLAASLTKAFETAKAKWLDNWRAGDAKTAQDEAYHKLSQVVGSDPLPYGIEANRPTIDALQRISVEERLIEKPLPMERLFAMAGAGA